MHCRYLSAVEKMRTKSSHEGLKSRIFALGESRQRSTAQHSTAHWLLRSRARSISQTSYNSGDFSLVLKTPLNNINSLGGDLLRESVFSSKIHISQIFNVSAAAETVANRARPFLPRQKSRRPGRERFCRGRNHGDQGGSVSAPAEIISEHSRICFIKSYKVNNNF